MAFLLSYLIENRLSALIKTTMTTKPKNLEYEEFKKILPKHCKYLRDTLCETASKLFKKMCNRGLYHYAKRPSPKEIGIAIDLKSKESNNLHIWVRVGKNTYQMKTGARSPHIPWFDNKTTGSGFESKAKANKNYKNNKK